MTYTLRLAAIFCWEVQRVLDAASLLAGWKSIAKVGAGVKFIEPLERVGGAAQTSSIHAPETQW
jgi:hypothetical protein